MQAEVDRLSTLLNDLLDLQRSRQPRLAMQPILPVLEHCVSLVARQAEMQSVLIYLDDAGEYLSALFDSQQLTQTVVNLLLKALEASPAGGTVRVQTYSDDGVVTVAVQDEGPGLNSEQQQHLFEPFYTAKPAGTGLGLAVSRELMRSQGGDLLYSALPIGARFIVEFPRNLHAEPNHSSG